MQTILMKYYYRNLKIESRINYLYAGFHVLIINGCGPTLHTYIHNIRFNFLISRDYSNIIKPNMKICSHKWYHTNLLHEEEKNC